MLILVTCVCIIIRCRPTGINTLNVRVCEGKSKTRHKLERN
ncbi:hypothetical protein MTR67_016270 [Solanum verrucosum]|uniref:Uncharacterized protein n=1 Tax=Solanum verrucosum TaxID=315347 RepID=A0AAF0QIE2_SOLVR|nr:hypothetical protein MTR67_016265 [Solanum verrucosum]WMV22885.1 hypothetical protein MTR67_016270 [Solanum verrucosum]